MFDLLSASLVGIFCSVTQEAGIWSLTLVIVLLGIHGYKNKSISLQPSCCVPCSCQISHVQQGQVCSGLTWEGVLWGCGKEPQNKRLCMKHLPLLCSTLGSFYSVFSCLFLFVYFIPQMWHYFLHVHFFFFLFSFFFFKWAKAIYCAYANCHSLSPTWSAAAAVPWRKSSSLMDSESTGSHKSFGT